MKCGLLACSLLSSATLSTAGPACFVPPALRVSRDIHPLQHHAPCHSVCSNTCAWTLGYSTSYVAVRVLSWPPTVDNDVKNIWHSTLRSKNMERRSFLRTYARAVKDCAGDSEARRAAYEMAQQLCGQPAGAADVEALLTQAGQMNAEGGRQPQSQQQQQHGGSRWSGLVGEALGHSGEVGFVGEEGQHMLGGTTVRSRPTGSTEETALDSAGGPGSRGCSANSSVVLTGEQVALGGGMGGGTGMMSSGAPRLAGFLRQPQQQQAPQQQQHRLMQGTVHHPIDMLDGAAGGSPGLPTSGHNPHPFNAPSSSQHPYNTSLPLSGYSSPVQAAQPGLQGRGLPAEGAEGGLFGYPGRVPISNSSTLSSLPQSRTSEFVDSGCLQRFSALQLADQQRQQQQQQHQFQQQQQEMHRQLGDHVLMQQRSPSPLQGVQLQPTAAPVPGSGPNSSAGVHPLHPQHSGGSGFVLQVEAAVAPAPAPDMRQQASHVQSHVPTMPSVNGLGSLAVEGAGQHILSLSMAMGSTGGSRREEQSMLLALLAGPMRTSGPGNERDGDDRPILSEHMSSMEVTMRGLLPDSVGADELLGLELGAVDGDPDADHFGTLDLPLLLQGGPAPGTAPPGPSVPGQRLGATQGPSEPAAPPNSGALGDGGVAGVKPPAQAPDVLDIARGVQEKQHRVSCAYFVATSVETVSMVWRRQLHLAMLTRWVCSLSVKLSPRCIYDRMCSMPVALNPLQFVVSAVSDRQAAFPHVSEDQSRQGTGSMQLSAGGDAPLPPYNATQHSLPPNGRQDLRPSHGSAPGGPEGDMLDQLLADLDREPAPGPRLGLGLGLGLGAGSGVGPLMAGKDGNSSGLVLGVGMGMGMGSSFRQQRQQQQQQQQVLPPQPDFSMSLGLRKNASGALNQFAGLGHAQREGGVPCDCACHCCFHLLKWVEAATERYQLNSANPTCPLILKTATGMLHASQQHLLGQELSLPQKLGFRSSNMPYVASAAGSLSTAGPGIGNYHTGNGGLGGAGEGSVLSGGNARTLLPHGGTQLHHQAGMLHTQQHFATASMPLQQQQLLMQQRQQQQQSWGGGAGPGLAGGGMTRMSGLLDSSQGYNGLNRPQSTPSDFLAASALAAGTGRPLQHRHMQAQAGLGVLHSPVGLNSPGGLQGQGAGAFGLGGYGMRSGLVGGPLGQMQASQPPPLAVDVVTMGLDDADLSAFLMGEDRRRSSALGSAAAAAPAAAGSLSSGDGGGLSGRSGGPLGAVSPGGAGTAAAGRVVQTRANNY